MMKKWMFAAAVSVMPFLAFAQTVQTPEEVARDASALTAQGKIGQAAALYMGEPGSWGGMSKNAMIAYENVLTAIQKRDMKALFYNSQFLPGSPVTAKNVDTLIKGIPGMSKEDTESIWKKCDEQYKRAQGMFKVAGTMKVVKSIPVDSNTAVVLVEEKAADGTRLPFTFLLNKKSGKWLIYGILLNVDGKLAK